MRGVAEEIAAGCNKPVPVNQCYRDGAMLMLGRLSAGINDLGGEVMTTTEIRASEESTREAWARK
jgi:hypothetical protein